MKTILVTAIGSFAGEATIRHLKQEGYRVIGCDIYPAEWVVNSREADGFYQVPYAAEGEVYLSFLQELCEKEQIDGILPLTDVEIDILTGSAFRTNKKTALLISSERTIKLCRDKMRLEKYLAPLHICRTIGGRTLADTEPEKAVYPLVVKPRNGRSSQGLVYVDCVAELAYWKEKYGARASGYLVQEKIEGTVITVDVIRSRESGKIICLPRRELLRTLNGCGTTVQVFTDETLEQQCRDIASVLDSRGCVNFEFIEDKEGERYFLECNPRFSGGIAFSCLAGYDMIRNHIHCFINKPLDPKPQIPSQIFARRYGEYQMKIGE